VLALYSSLFTLAVSTIAWPTGVGLAAGALVGGALAYGLVDRVLRAQGANPQRGLVRRLSTVCCLLWGLALPLGAMAAGVVWGVGFGVGTLVDGPVSTTIPVPSWPRTTGRGILSLPLKSERSLPQIPATRILIFTSPDRG